MNGILWILLAVFITMITLPMVISMFPIKKCKGNYSEAKLLLILLVVNFTSSYFLLLIFT